PRAAAASATGVSRSAGLADFTPLVGVGTAVGGDATGEATPTGDAAATTALGDSTTAGARCGAGVGVAGEVGVRAASATQRGAVRSTSPPTAATRDRRIRPG